MNRSRLLLSVKYIDCAVFVSPHILAHFQSSIKINWQVSVFELKNAAGERMLKMMEKKNNEKCEFIDRTAWFTRLRSEVLLVLIYKLSARPCCRVSF